MSDPKEIWLQPWCDECERHARYPDAGRLWAPDDPWTKCDDCDRKPVRYVLAELES